MRRLIMQLGLACLGLAAAITVITGPGTLAASPTSYNRASAVFPAGDLVRGKVLAEPCLACHGDNPVTLGQPAYHPPYLRYQRISSLFYALEDYRSGARKSEFMAPVAQAMSDQDMRDVAAYLSARTLSSRPPARSTPALADSWAHGHNGEVCGMCHGEAGLGVMDGYPALAGQQRDYIEHALNSYRNGSRSNKVMALFARSLKPEEVPQMAAYFAAQSGLEPVK